MDGERKLFMVVMGIVVPCITVLYVILFLSLWQYKELIGASLLGIVRMIRFRHHEETPLDSTGEPMYYHQGFQQNPHRR